MADQFYADATVVTLGAKFSTDNRYLRRAISSPLVTYLQAGPTLQFTYFLGDPTRHKLLAYRCGPWTLRMTNTADNADLPSNTVTNVVL